jgi:(1->4)-alpha-D-glucan 1-alpha-D-glucosylmutase
VDGTTGYEFTNLASGFLVDPAGEEPLTRHYVEFTSERKTFAEIVHECKVRIMRSEMGSELNVLAREVAQVARSRPTTADFTHNVLRRAIREVVACFPVYRTYVDSEGKPTTDDRRDLKWAMKQARVNESTVDASVFDFVCKVLSGDLVAEGRSGFSRHAVLRCAMKLQQYSGPVMAKGLEDTAFYRYNRFIALNEVGGYPDRFGVSLANFHRANAYRAKHWPNSMVSTSTHDTKRGEDTRARLAVLSEIPDEWIRQTTLWSHILRARRGDIEAAGPPDHNDEYLFYQLLTGTWPVELIGLEPLDVAAVQLFTARIKGAMTKSMREAKVNSTWASPDTAYENAVRAFVEAALDPENSRAFFAGFLPFVARVARLSVQNSLVQTTLKLTVPGVPDIYQGSELWDLSMVDPDNRRPVDYGRRIRLLDEIATRPIQELLQNSQDGALKMFVVARILALRAEEPQLFAQGEYEPMVAAGPASDCICAFARRLEGRAVVVLAARFPVRLQGSAGWRGTTIALPPGLEGEAFKEVLTGVELSGESGVLDAAAVFADLPVAVLRANVRA